MCALQETARLQEKANLEMNAVALVRPLFMDQWPSNALTHVLILVAYAVAGFWLALALTRKRFAM